MIYWLCTVRRTLTLTLTRTTTVAAIVHRREFSLRLTDRPKPDNIVLFTTVELHGLQSAAASQLNGKRGEVLSSPRGAKRPSGGQRKGKGGGTGPSSPFGLGEESPSAEVAVTEEEERVTHT